MKSFLKKFILSCMLIIGIVSIGLIAQPAEAAVGDTIAATFPDANLAQAVADQVAGGDVNAILTQGMVDGCTILDGSFRGIQDLTGIDNLTALTKLELHNNQLSSLPESIGNPTLLTELNLSNNQLTSLPESIGNLSSLRILYLKHNQLSILPESIGTLTSLKTLEIGGNSLINLPESIGDLTSLMILDLENNGLSSLPASIGNLSALTELYLSQNEISILPDNISNLTSLVNLGLQGNQLSSLPESIGNLSALAFVTLGDNQLSSLPESLWNITSLVYLDVYNNQLSSVSESISNLSSLMYLFLDNNQLTSLPEGIGNLNSLENLDISNNKLKDIPESIGNLSSLRYFSSYRNQLTRLPESIGNLNSLIYLLLDNNQLTSFPDSFGNLTSLEYLFLENNLLPTNYGDLLNTFGFGFTISSEPQDKLKIETVTPITVKSQSDIDTIDYSSFLGFVNSAGTVSPSHTFILENYKDENNVPVDINDYIQNGVVIKTGKVYAQVRATGAGLFPNNSDNALTDEFIELNFVIPEYTLAFNLNGGTGTAPATQILKEGETGVAVTNPTREGFSFKGWNTAADGSGSNWIPGTTPMSGVDVTLYAQWEEQTKPTPPTTGKITDSTLPKTGGYRMVLLTIITIGVGALAIKKGIKKIK